MRRRRTSPAQAAGIPESLSDFTPGQWPGGSEYQKWKAWDEARQSWATVKLSGGAEDLPGWDGMVPDQPWDEVKHTI